MTVCPQCKGRRTVVDTESAVFTLGMSLIFKFREDGGQKKCPTCKGNVDMKYNPDDLRQSGYSIGYDPTPPNSTKPTVYSKKRANGDYPKIEGEFKEEEYGQVPLRASIIECGVKYHNDVEAKLREREFKNFLGFGRKEKGLFWFRFKHNNKGFHIKNTKIYNYPNTSRHTISKCRWCGEEDILKIDIVTCTMD